MATTSNFYNKIKNNIDIYELTTKDLKFLQNLENRISFTDSFSKLSEFDIKRWKKVLIYTIESAKRKDTISYLAISNNQPCGLISCYKDARSLFVDGISAIPLPNLERVNYTGTTLFYHIFKLANFLKLKKLELNAVANGPFNVLKKYANLGFKKHGMNGEYIIMSCNKYKIKEQLEKLSLNIIYKPNESNQQVNLENLVI